MTTYVYTCTNENCTVSDDTFEVNQRITDDALKICRECDKETLRRVVVPAGNHRISGGYTGTTMWNNSDDPGAAKHHKQKMGIRKN